MYYCDAEIYQKMMSHRAETYDISGIPITSPPSYIFGC